MNTADKFSVFSLAAILCLVLAACASKPVLLTRGAVAPAGVDFSGRWQLRPEPGSARPTADAREPGIRIPPKNPRSAAAQRSTRRAPGSAVQVFLENGEALKISQTANSLFISFDRAVVEEYTFGENRTVSVGPIKAQRVSGWTDTTFVAQTLDEQGSILTESWRLHDASTLLREIRVTHGKSEKLSVDQRYERM